MRIKVLYFAAIRELIGCREETLELEGDGGVITLGDIRRRLCERHPRAAPSIQEIALARNLEYAVDDAAVVADGDEVALIPPISGG